MNKCKLKTYYQNIQEMFVRFHFDSLKIASHRFISYKEKIVIYVKKIYHKNKKESLFFVENIALNFQQQNRR